MKIAVIGHCHHPISEPFVGGLETHTYLMCKQLHALGHEVTLFAKEGTTEQGWKVVPILESSYEFKHMPSGSVEWARREATFRHAYETAADTIEGEDFDVAINNSLNPAVLDWRSKVPVLNILHIPVTDFLKAPAMRAGRVGNKVFASVSAFNARAWSEVVPNVVPVLNGIDISQWQSSKPKDDSLRWSARIAPTKGLVDAVKTANISGRDLKIAGPIRDVDYFNEMVRPLLGGHIEYVGHLDHNELADFYSSGTATLVPTQWDEPFGMVSAESLACGTPVAAYSRGANPELITDDIGALAAEQTPEALAQAVDVAVTKTSEDCRNAALERFDYSRMVNEYVDILDGMITNTSDGDINCAV